MNLLHRQISKIFLIFGDCILITGSILVAYALRFEFQIPSEHWTTVLYMIGGMIIFQWVSFAYFNIYVGYGAMPASANCILYLNLFL